MPLIQKQAIAHHEGLVDTPLPTSVRLVGFWIFIETFRIQILFGNISTAIQNHFEEVFACLARRLDFDS